MSLQYESIPKNQIQPCPFVFRFGNHDFSELQKSIDQMSLLSPLLVWKKNEDYLLLDGGLRLQCLLSDFIPTIIFEGETHKQAFLLALESNSWSRSFNLMEAALIIKQAEELGCKEPVLEKLGIKNPHFKKDYLLLLKLPQKIQQAVVDLNWPLHVAIKWEDIDVSERESLFDVLKSLPFNQNKWGEILSWLSDIAKRDQSSVLVLTRDIFSLFVSVSDPIQRSHLFREELEKRRFPRLKIQQESFSRVLQKTKLAKGIQMEPSPFFDSREIFIKAKISSQEDVEKIKECLNENFIQDLLEVMG